MEILGSSEPSTSRSDERRVVATLTLATFLGSLAGFVYGPFLPAIAHDLGISITLVGQVPALVALAATIIGLVAGPLADQFGLRRSLVLALVALAVSTLGIGLAPVFVLLFPAALIGAVGRAMSTPVAQAVVGSSFGDNTRRTALSWMTAGVSGAIVVGVPLLTTIAAALGWRGAFVILGLLTVANAVALRRFISPDDSPQAIRLRPLELLEAYRPVVKHRPSVGLIGAFLLSNCGVSGALLTYLGAFLAERHGLNTQQIGWVYLAIGLGAFTGSLAAGGRLGDRPLRPLILASRLGVALLLGAAFLAPVSAVVVAGLLTLVLVLIALANVATATLLTAESPAGRATTMTLNGSASQLGAAIGAGLGGVILALGGYSLLGITVVVWLIGSALFVWWSIPLGRQAS